MIIRKIDDVGRIAIPKDIRRELRWMGGDELEIITNPDESITIRRPTANISSEKVYSLSEDLREWGKSNKAPINDYIEKLSQLTELMKEIESKKADK